MEPQFYESLMEILSSTNISKDKDAATNKSIKSVSSGHLGSDPDSVEQLSSITVIADQRELKRIKKQQRQKRKASLRKNKKISKEETVLYELEADDKLDLEEQYVQSVVTSNHKSSGGIFKKCLIFISTIISVVAVVLFYSESPEKIDQDYISLKKVQFNQPQLSENEVELLIKKGMRQYFNSTFLSYLKSQEFIVQAVQGDNKNTYAMALLCMVYLELWPFSRQDFQAEQTVFTIVQKTSVLNKGGIRSGVCHSVGLIIKTRYQDAKTTIESSLDGLDNARENEDDTRLTPLLYYLKAKVLYYLNDYPGTISYLGTIQKILPKWIQLHILSADILLKQGKVSEALSVYRKVLNIDSNNKIAQIGLGLLEYKHFKKIDKARKLLQNAISNNFDRIPYGMLSSAYLVLAQIDLKKGLKVSALENARQAYSYNPADNVSKELIIQLGGEQKLKTTRIRSDQLIYEGDQLVLQNKHQQAIGYYERAFKAKTGGNAVVAVKAAKSFWILSFF